VFFFCDIQYKLRCLTVHYSKTAPPGSYNEGQGHESLIREVCTLRNGVVVKHSCDMATNSIWLRIHCGKRLGAQTSQFLSGLFQVYCRCIRDMARCFVLPVCWEVVLTYWKMDFRRLCISPQSYFGSPEIWPKKCYNPVDFSLCPASSLFCAQASHRQF